MKVVMIGGSGSSLNDPVEVAGPEAIPRVEPSNNSEAQSAQEARYEALPCAGRL